MSVRVAIDSNILVYPELEPASEKARLAVWLIGRSSMIGAISAQALLEFVAVIRRRRPDRLADAMASVAAWGRVFDVSPTTEAVIFAALELVRSHRFQVWDAVIWSAAKAAGAEVLFTEDLHDGLTLGGVRAINPFSRSQAQLETLLPTAP